MSAANTGHSIGGITRRTRSYSGAVRASASAAGEAGPGAITRVGWPSPASASMEGAGRAGNASETASSLLYAQA